MIASLRPHALACAPAMMLVVLACSSSQPVRDPVVDPDPGAGVNASNAAGSGAAGAPPGRNLGWPGEPPTIETCRAREKPEGQARFAALETYKTTVLARYR